MNEALKVLVLVFVFSFSVCLSGFKKIATYGGRYSISPESSWRVDVFDAESLIFKSSSSHGELNQKMMVLLIWDLTQTPELKMHDFKEFDTYVDSESYYVKIIVPLDFSARHGCLVTWVEENFVRVTVKTNDSDLEKIFEFDLVNNDMNVYSLEGTLDESSKRSTGQR